MNSKYFGDVLALLGALVILIGVSAAADIALAGDLGTIEIYSAIQR
ncbi:MAG: hypothetical protein OSA87_01820 [Woeseiaceae bacterium]|nr:hypothetical protein [Woeseiaceae bacterium]